MSLALYGGTHGRGHFKSLQAVDVGYTLNKAEKAQALNNLCENSKALPVYQARQQLLETIRSSQVTLVQAETGSGKTTFIPPFLGLTFEKTICAEPRIMAAKLAAQYVNGMFGVNNCNLAALKTSEDDTLNPAAIVNYCTDGIAILHFLFRSTSLPKILVIDEIHEMSFNIISLLALAVEALNSGEINKLVLLSATPNTDKIKDYLSNNQISLACLSIPGRQHSIEQRPKGKSKLADALNLVSQGARVLWFEPGMEEIKSCVRSLEDSRCHVPIDFIHADQSKGSRESALRILSSPRVIVSSAVAEASVTLGDINAVIDSGLSRVVFDNGVVTELHTLPSSLDVKEQRKGRAGRVSAGICIDHCPTDLQLRDSNTPIKAKITEIAGFILRLINAGKAIEKLNFIQELSPHEITSAKKLLVDLGCIDEKHKIIKKGQLVCLCPLNLREAVIVAESIKLGIKNLGIMAAAIMSVGGISFYKKKTQQLQANLESDVLTDVERLNEILRTNTPSQYLDMLGVDEDQFYQAQVLATKVHRRFGTEIEVEDLNQEKLTLLRRAICAAYIHSLMHITSDTSGRMSFLCSDGQTRYADRGSRVSWDSWYVGNQLDQTFSPLLGDIPPIRTAKMLTSVSDEWIREYGRFFNLQQLPAQYVYDQRSDQIRNVSGLSLGTRTFDLLGQACQDTSVDHAEILAKWLLDKCRNQSMRELPENLAEIIAANRETLKRDSYANEEILKYLKGKIGTAKCFAEIKDLSSLRIEPILAPGVVGRIKIKQLHKSEITVGRKSLVLEVPDLLVKKIIFIPADSFPDIGTSAPELMQQISRNPDFILASDCGDIRFSGPSLRYLQKCLYSLLGSRTLRSPNLEEQDYTLLSSYSQVTARSWIWDITHSLLSNKIYVYAPESLDLEIIGAIYEKASEQNLLVEFVNWDRDLLNRRIFESKSWEVPTYQEACQWRDRCRNISQQAGLKVKSVEVTGLGLVIEYHLAESSSAIIDKLGQELSETCPLSLVFKPYNAAGAELEKLLEHAKLSLQKQGIGCDISIRKCEKLIFCIEDPHQTYLHRLHEIADNMSADLGFPVYLGIVNISKS